MRTAIASRGASLDPPRWSRVPGSSGRVRVNVLTRTGADAMMCRRLGNTLGVVMEGKKQDVPLQYEPPRVVDHGSLFEMTAMRYPCDDIRHVFKGQGACSPPRFS